MLNAGGHLALALRGLAAALAGRAGAPAGLAAEHAGQFAALAGRAHGPDWESVVAALTPPDAPLARLAAAGLDRLAIRVLLGVGLAEEEPRLAAMLGDGRLATAGGIVTALAGLTGDDAPLAVRAALAGLLQRGLVHSSERQLPRPDQPLTVPLWDALAGSPVAPPGTRLETIADLPVLADLLLEPDTAAAAAALAEPLRGRGRAADLAVLLRGPPGNGRRTLARAIAGAAGRPLLMMEDAAMPLAPALLHEAGLAALLAGAALLLAPSLAPGEALTVPPLPLAGVPLLLVLGPGGSVALPGRTFVALAVTPPDATRRAALWQRAVPGLPDAEAAALAGLRLASGAIIAAAAGAQLRATARGAPWPLPADATAVLADMPDPRLELLATRVAPGAPRPAAETPSPDPETPVLDAAASAELDALITRCTLREALAGASSAAGIGPGALGVRALFSGPSGAGKTLAARHVARTLGRELWRIDLSAVVNKYIGETEKALDRALSAAEARDIVLLLDEGDALMARRTDVANANDRYANLETNFLLQRLENFAGILIVTTNAPDRIDSAFARRMDVVVPFRAADARLRQRILAAHLGDHAISESRLAEVAARCVLSGGQLRNIAVAVQLAALSAGRKGGDDDLLAAVAREYRKQGTPSPVKAGAAG